LLAYSSREEQVSLFKGRNCGATAVEGSYWAVENIMRVDRRMSAAESR
jgi:hypothetical protein